MTEANGSYSTVVWLNASALCARLYASDVGSSPASLHIQESFCVVVVGLAVIKLL